MSHCFDSKNECLVSTTAGSISQLESKQSLLTPSSFINNGRLKT